MSEDVSAKVPAYGRCQTKAALERAAAEGYNAEVRIDDIRGVGAFDRPASWVAPSASTTSPRTGSFESLTRTSHGQPS